MLSRRKSMWMRLPASPSVPSTPSAPPSASGTIGRRFGSTSKSPNSSVSTGTNGTWAEPVAPRSMTVWDGSNAMPSSATTRAVSAEWLAPVSSTRRNGPWPLIVTGAQMRPILSRRVGRDEAGFVRRDGDVLHHVGARGRRAFRRDDRRRQLGLGEQQQER